MNEEDEFMLSFLPMESKRSYRTKEETNMGCQNWNRKTNVLRQTLCIHMP